MGAIIQNLGTIIVCISLALAITGIIAVLRRDKKMGKCSCGTSCGACPMRDSCHTPKDKSEE